MTAASVAGGAAGAIVNRSVDPWHRKIAEGGCGALAGIFWGPSIGAAMGVHEARDTVAVSFAVGAIGYGLVTMIVDYAKGAAFKEWLGRFFGPTARPPGPPAPPAP